MALLITASNVISNVPAYELNLDEAYIDRVIKPVQNMQLPLSLGSGFLAEIVASGWMQNGIISSGISLVASGLMDKVFDYMCYSVGAQAIPLIKSSVGNSGLYQNSPDYTQKSSKEDSKNLRDTLKSFATLAERELIDYLTVNIDSFPTYKRNCGNKQRDQVFKSFGLVNNKTGTRAQKLAAGGFGYWLCYEYD